MLMLTLTDCTAALIVFPAFWIPQDQSKIITRTNPKLPTKPEPISPAGPQSQEKTSLGLRTTTIQPNVKPNNPVHTSVTELSLANAHSRGGPSGTSAALMDIHPPENVPAGSPRVDLNVVENEPNDIRQDTITREMSIAEVLERLSRHGCKDVTQELDLSKFSEYPISSGGYGDVYRGAFHNGQLVAVKCLRLHMDSNEIAEKQLKRAARELYVWSKCDHPNVLALIGVGQYRNQVAMVSPWMEYGNVRRLLSLKPQVDRFALCLQVANGIAYLHDVDVIHGDLKGDNVLVSGDIVPKVTDFGNAALREYTLLFSKTTGRAGISLNWVAPELLDEETGLTAEADVYSLGMTIFEIITGSPPYTGLRESLIMRKILGGVHPTRPEEHIPTGIIYANLLWSLLKSCWAFSPKDRPTSAEARDKMKEVISEREKHTVSGGEKEN